MTFFVDAEGKTLIFQHVAPKNKQAENDD